MFVAFITYSYFRITAVTFYWLLAMSKANDLTCSSHFVTHDNPISLGVKWQKWRQVFIFYLAPKDITDAHQKKTLMLQNGSTDLQKIYLTLNIPPLTNDSNVYDYACTLLDNHILPKQNKPCELHLFCSISQRPDETISQYVTRLYTLANSVNSLRLMISWQIRW